MSAFSPPLGTALTRRRFLGVCLVALPVGAGPVLLPEWATGGWRPLRGHTLVRIEPDGREGLLHRVLVVVTPAPGAPAVQALHLTATGGADPVVASYHLNGLGARVVVPLALEVERPGWMRAEVETVGGGRWSAVRRLRPAPRCRNT